MGTRRKPSPPSRTRLAFVSAAVAGGGVLASATVTTTAAHAEPAPSLAEVKAQVEQLNEQAEASIEQYNGLQERQRKLQADAGLIQDRVARGQEQISQLRTRLGALAAEQYRTGGVGPTVRLMFTADPDTYLAGASLDRLAAGSQADALRELQAQQRKLDQQRAEATEVLAQLEGGNAKLAAEKQGIQTRLAQANALLGRLSAADRARVNAQSDDGRSSRSDARASYTGPATGRAADVLRFAYAQLGKPYRWGATGPDSYDCSGLTGAAWRAGGVSLPRVSQDQWNAGQHVAKADLQAGDLVFFYNDLHHVGIYIGDGKMIHAPRTGKNVEITAIDYMPYVGAVRP
ncbi:NlpC/P60 family protein [Kitasatospora sp. NPDC002227]|uniref:C40 family peptidase n=1 Tax=Kitasatospora sp. NPDC002227 TaxID=3154773 RepID=UPI00331BFAAE